MNFKEKVRKKLEGKDKKPENLRTPLDKAILSVAHKTELNRKQQALLRREGMAFYNDRKDSGWELTERGKKRLSLLENTLEERFNPDEPAPKTKVEAGYESFVSYLKKNGVSVSKKQVKRWFNKREKELKALENSLKKNEKIRNPQAAYWGAVRKRMLNSFK